MPKTHLSDCEATITKRRRARRHWRSRVSVRGGQMGTKPLPSVQLHSDLNSDVNSISKSGDLASPHTLEDQKEKRVGEEEREGLAEIYYLARKHYGERGASVAAKALNAGRSAS